MPNNKSNAKPDVDPVPTDWPFTPPPSNANPDVDPNAAPDSMVPVTETIPELVAGVRPEVPTEPLLAGVYRLLGELGRGGMGVVYRAEDTRLKREVAIKLMLPPFAANEQAKARFIREARSQARVEHEHVAVIHQVAEHDDLPFLVMPLLKGMTLHAALRANPRPPLLEVIRIGREMAEGLAAAHEKGLVHRDIKPANIWLEGKKLSVKVLDFGLARAITDADNESESEDGPVTREGAIIGTPAYMSPEQGRGQPVDNRTDLFSLGVVLYQMTTGELPYRGPNTLAILTSLGTDTPPAPITRNPYIPPVLSDLVMRLLAKDPAFRPQTAEALAGELREIELAEANSVRVIPLGELPPIVVAASGPDPFAELDATEGNTTANPQSAPHSPANRIPRRGFPVWVAVAVVLLAVAGLVAFVAQQLGKKPPAITDEDVAKPPGSESPKTQPPKPGVEPKTSTTVLSPFFNGKDLTGWVAAGKKSGWRAENGSLVWEHTTGLGVYDTLTSQRLFGDFELSFRVRHLQEVEKGTISFRFRHMGKLDSNLNSLSFGQTHATCSATKRKAVVGLDGSYELLLRCVGKHMVIVVNGVTLAGGDYDIPAEGPFFWIDGGGFKGHVVVSDIRFMDLTFFNGKDLTGWFGAENHWRVENGDIVGSFPGEPPAHITDLISTRDFTDFELSFQVRVVLLEGAKARGPYPGVVVRGRISDLAKHQVGGTGCLIGATYWGQVSQGPKSTTRPTPAALAAVKPKEFNDMTIRCVGSRMTVTVNGVVAVEEDREKILATGVIAWQMTPGTQEMRFKNIRFTDLSPPK